jgi:hypothetical protein
VLTNGYILRVAEENTTYAGAYPTTGYPCGTNEFHGANRNNKSNNPTSDAVRATDSKYDRRAFTDDTIRQRNHQQDLNNQHASLTSTDIVNGIGNSSCNNSSLRSSYPSNIILSRSVI